MGKEYLLSRMRASLAMAEKTSNAVARLIHYDLAGRYRIAAAAQDEDLRYGRSDTRRPSSAP